MRQVRDRVDPEPGDPDPNDSDEADPKNPESESQTLETQIPENSEIFGIDPVPSPDPDPDPHNPPDPPTSHEEEDFFPEETAPDLCDSDSDDEADEPPSMPSFTNLGKRATHKHLYPPEEHVTPSLTPMGVEKSAYHVTLKQAIKNKPDAAVAAALHETIQMFSK
jgi:hypothetical protein